MNVSSNHDARETRLTLGQVAHQRLRSLCSALRWPRVEAAEEALELLTKTFKAEPLRDTPSWSTDLTDDGSPFEFSLAFEREIELRLLAEAQRPPFNLASNWNAAAEINQAIASGSAASLQRFEQIAPLFAPRVSRPSSFALWHSACVNADAPTTYKLYLNPQIEGDENARALIMEALRRLKLDDGARFIEERLDRPNERFVYFSLDLSAAATARVKVYFTLDINDLARAESLFAGTKNYHAGSLFSWLETLVGTTAQQARETRPLLACVSFSHDARPHMTLHVPIRCYSPDDEQALRRTISLLEPHHANRLEHAVRSWATRPLDAGGGLISYVSCRAESTMTRVTVYLAPQLFTMTSARSENPAPIYSDIHQIIDPSTVHAAPIATTMASVRERIQRRRAHLVQHAFVRRLDTTGSFAAIRAMASHLTFFVLAFQDVLRLVRAKAGDGPLAALARAHEEEDRGHEQWFLNDLEVLGAAPDVKWVFSNDHAVTRDVGYAVVADVLQMTDDRSRLALLLSLEAAGAEFFGRVIAYLDRIGYSKNLQYFARPHQHVEQNHSVFEADEQRRLWASPLPEHVHAEALDAVDRTFANVARLATELDSVMAEVERAEQVAS
jgi:hypothetical protein